MPRALQACDACKRRKVRCNGEPCCQQCAHLNLKCHYVKADPSSRSRRNVDRGAVILAYKGPTPQPSRSASTRLVPREATLVPPTSSSSDGLDPFDAGVCTTLFAHYTTCVFPFLPVIPERDIQQSLCGAGADRLDRAERAVIYALAAVTMNMTRVGVQHPPSFSAQVAQLYTRALELRGTIMPHDVISTKSVMVPFLVSICLFAGRHNTDMAFYYLREAITRVQILHDRESERPCLSSHSRDQAQGERLYWLFFIHERFVAIMYNRSTVLLALRTLPHGDSDTPPGVVEGFSHLIRLFSIIDADFIVHWLGRERSPITLAWVERKQIEIGTGIDDCEQEIMHLTDMQQVDLFVTRYWLQTLLWQMALSNLLLTSTIDRKKEFMSILFPIVLSRRLRSILAAMPRQAVEVHGMGIVQKILDITNTIADILELIPAATSHQTSENAHLDDFLFLYQFLLTMSQF